jgi:hypothetical protein
MHDAYTKMPFPPYPLTLTTCVTSRLFYEHRHKLEKPTAQKTEKKEEGVESFDRSRFRLSSLPWRFPSTIPSIKTKPPKVGYRLLNHVSPRAPLKNAYFGFTIRPKLPHSGGNLRSQVRNPHKLRAGATIWELRYSNCAWKCIAK